MLVGLVGKPSSGKSTFFKALTLAEVEIGPYPFVTLKPNSGVGYVKIDCVETHFGVKCNPREGYCIDSKRFVPVEILDVAGLVPGAHEGKGMGNQFLDDLRQANVLIHVVDCSGSTNEKGESVDTGSYDPANDLRFLEEELDMWYLGILKRGWDKFARTIQQEHREIDKALAKQLSGLRVTEDMVKDTIKKLNLNVEKPAEWDPTILKKIATELRKLTKPMVIACNKIDVPGAYEKYEKLKQEFPDYVLIPCSAESELALKEAAKKELIKYIPGEKTFEITDESKLSPQQLKGLQFVKTNVVEKFGTGVQQVVDEAVFNLLEYITIFPGGVNNLVDSNGNVLPDCFLMPKGTTALDFAFRLHTDFGNNFIKAIDVKTKMPVGKNHILKDRDVVEICYKK
jgi:ribosome-binding ATPase